MPKNNKTSKYNIPNPEDVLKLPSKYKFGDSVNNFNELKSHKPVFAFDYISLNREKFCFNSNLLQLNKDYNKLLENLKKISSKTYNDLRNDKSHHFHEVDFNDVTISVSDFIKCITKDYKNVNSDHAPTVYQFKIFEEARIFGFIYNYVFYLVFFDRNHNAYKRK